METTINNGFSKIDKDLSKKADIEIVTRIERKIEDIKDNKLDAKDFEPYKSMLSNILKIVVTAIIGAVLVLVLK